MDIWGLKKAKRDIMCFQGLIHASSEAFNLVTNGHPWLNYIPPKAAACRVFLPLFIFHDGRVPNRTPPPLPAGQASCGVQSIAFRNDQSKAPQISQTVRLRGQDGYVIPALVLSKAISALSIFNIHYSIFNRQSSIDNTPD
ncbi:MAG: hypothetical protein KAU50_05435 [Candidatus Marinimicrobia bacterium]|nr:hypothetical protein [Candidatus Neomarinimicrobiota bacterium]